MAKRQPEEGRERDKRQEPAWGEDKPGKLGGTITGDSGRCNLTSLPVSLVNLVPKLIVSRGVSTLTIPVVYPADRGPQGGGAHTN